MAEAAPVPRHGEFDGSRSCKQPGLHLDRAIRAGQECAAGVHRFHGGVGRTGLFRGRSVQRRAVVPEAEFDRGEAHQPWSALG